MAISSTAEQQARRLLGDLDLSTYGEQRNVAQRQYDTGVSTLRSDYETLLNQINKNKQEGREDFSSSRAVISEDAFDRARGTQTDLSSRLAGASSGLQDLGKVSNRIETGRQMSDVANKYYRSLSNLVESERQAGEKKAQGERSLSDSLAGQLANIGSAEQQARSNYGNSLSSLALQIQQQMDARAAAERAAANAAASLRMQQNQLNKENYERGLGLVEAFKQTIASNPDAYLDDTKLTISLIDQYKTALDKLGAGDMKSMLGGAFREAVQGDETRGLVQRQNTSREVNQNLQDILNSPAYANYMRRQNSNYSPIGMNITTGSNSNASGGAR